MKWNKIEDNKPRKLDSSKEVLRFGPNDSLDWYLDYIAQFPVMPDLISLSLIPQAQAGNIDARDRIVTGNLRLVIKPAVYYDRVLSTLRSDNAGLGKMDLVGYGNLGLIKAVQSYRFDKGSGFPNWAVNRIVIEIKSNIGRAMHIVSIPKHITTEIIRLRREKDRLEQQLGRELSVNEFAGSTINPRETRRMLSLGSLNLSLDEKIEGLLESDEAARGDIIESPKPPLESQVSESLLPSFMSELLSILPDQEREIIVMYYYERQMDKEIAKRMGIIDKRVTVIRNLALRRLLIEARRLGLHTYIE